MLVATKPTARRTSAVKIVPNAPNCKVVSVLQMQPLSLFSQSPAKAATKNVTIRRPTAIPKPIQAKGIEIIVVPVIVRTSATIPEIRLATMLKIVQPVLQLQLKKPIISPPLTVYAQAFNNVIADGIEI